MLYVSLPISSSNHPKPDLLWNYNILRGERISSALVRLGIPHYNPIFSTYVHRHRPLEHEVWLDYDFKVIDQCSALLVAGWQSKGVRAEIEYAKSKGMDVLYTINNMVFNCIGEMVIIEVEPIDYYEDLRARVYESDLIEVCIEVMKPPK